MKTSAILSAAVLAAGVLLGAAGCVQPPIIAGSHTSSGSRSARNFALAVTLSDGSQLTPAQWATVKSAFQQQLAAEGYALVDDLSLADHIIRVVFNPTVEDPANGSATVVSVRSNPAYAFNPSPSPFPLSSSYSSSFGYDPSRYGSPFGYNDVNYSGGSTVIPRVDPPRHHRPNQPDDCVPGAADRTPGTFAGHHGGDGSGSSDHGHRSWPTDTNGSQSSSGYARSSDSGSGNVTSRSSADGSGSHDRGNRSSAGESGASHSTSGYTRSSDSGSSSSNYSSGSSSSGSSSSSYSASSSSSSSSFSPSPTSSPPSSPIADSTPNRQAN